MVLIALLLGTGALAQPGLTLSGTCPGPIQVDILGVTPGATVALLTGDAPGADAIPAGAPCGGNLSGLSGAKVMARLTDTDGDGALHQSANLPAGQCGRSSCDRGFRPRRPTGRRGDDG